MRTFAIVVSLACLSAPALAQTPCSSGYEVASKAFVDNFQHASVAMSASDYRGALSLVSAARPHASSGQQLTALTQIEISALVELDLPAAKQRMRSALGDQCLPAAVRQAYVEKLAE